MFSGGTGRCAECLQPDTALAVPAEDLGALLEAGIDLAGL